MASAASNTVLDRATDFLMNVGNVLAAGLSGSRARNAEDAYSDFGLVVFKPEKVPSYSQARSEQRLKNHLLEMSMRPSAGRDACGGPCNAAVTSLFASTLTTSSFASLPLTGPGTAKKSAL